MENKRIPVNLNQKDKNIHVTLEQDFDTLNVLSMSLTNDDVYSSQRGDFGVLMGRVMLNGGFGLQNAKVSVFIPISEEDQQRPEIRQIYPFENVRDTFPNGLRYNLLPRVQQSNESHIPVGTFPDISDFTNYPTYLEVYEKYYKFTTTTNEAGDYMIFGVPTGVQSVHMDFDLFDTNSFTVNADDLVANLGFSDELNNGEGNEIPGFIYLGDNHYQVNPKTNINDMPNIFGQDKTVEVIPFWGNEAQSDIGITRCDFNIEYDLRPTAIFFGSVLYPTEGFTIRYNYELSGAFTEFDELNSEFNLVGPQIDKNVFPPNDLKVAVWYYENDEEFKLYDVFNGLNETPGAFRLNLPMLTDYYTVNEFGDIVKSNSENGVPTTANYYFEFFEHDELFSGRRSLWGGYNVGFTPGFRVPATNDGDAYRGGWVDFNTQDRLFSYDIFNNKRKFYTIKTRYRKHRVDTTIDTDVQSQTNVNDRLLLDWDTYLQYDAIFKDFVKRISRYDSEEVDNDLIRNAVSIIQDSYYGDLVNEASPEVERLVNLLDSFNFAILNTMITVLFSLNFDSYLGLIRTMNVADVEVRENDGIYLILQSIRKGNPSVSNTDILTSDNVGGGLYFMPKIADNENAFWNYPFTGVDDIPENRFAEVIGNFYAPRIEFDGERESEDDSFSLTNVEYPSRLMWLPFKENTETGNQWVEKYEWLLGVGVSLDGVNKGQGFVNVFGADEVRKTNQSQTYYYGDNAAFNIVNPVPNSQTYVGQLPVVERELPEEFNATNGIFKPYNLKTSKSKTDGLFIESASRLSKQTPLAEVLIEDITDDLPNLVKDRVYSSYNKSDDNTYNNRYYYFGRYLEENSLYNIEKLYFNEL